MLETVTEELYYTLTKKLIKAERVYRKYTLQVLTNRFGIASHEEPLNTLYIKLSIVHLYRS